MRAGGGACTGATRERIPSSLVFENTQGNLQGAALRDHLLFGSCSQFTGNRRSRDYGNAGVRMQSPLLDSISVGYELSFARLSDETTKYTLDRQFLAGHEVRVGWIFRFQETLTISYHKSFQRALMVN